MTTLSPLVDYLPGFWQSAKQNGCPANAMSVLILDTYGSITDAYSFAIPENQAIEHLFLLRDSLAARYNEVELDPEALLLQWNFATAARGSYLEYESAFFCPASTFDTNWPGVLAGVYA